MVGRNNSNNTGIPKLLWISISVVNLDALMEINFFIPNVPSPDLGCVTSGIRARATTLVPYGLIR